MRTMVMSLAAMAVLAACGQTGGSTTPPAETPPAAAMPQTAEEATAQDTCGASRFQNLIGTLASELDQSTLPAGTRVITPETMVTQDFRPERLNIMTGTDGRISSLRCF